MISITVKNATFSLTEMDIKLLKVLLSQSEHKDKVKIIPDIDPNEILSLLEARIIYSELFGFQYEEEKEILPRLKIMFKTMVELNKLL